MDAPNLPPGFDFIDPDIYAQRLPVRELAELRATAPIWWNEQPPDQGGFGDGGYWVVTTHRDTREVSLRSDLFSSAKKSIVPRYRDDLAQGQIEPGRASMTMMDDPEFADNDALALFYRSANFDEAVFDRRHAFDVLRSPNPNLGLGGTGAHCCIGANLARMTIEVMFNAIADHTPDLAPHAKPSGRDRPSSTASSIGRSITSDGQD
jgi:cytochrome P450